LSLLGVVTGLAAEAAFLPSSESLIVRCRGPGPDAARRAAEDALASGATALLSFGLAGGLDPAFAPGSLIVANAIVDSDGARIETDAAWRGRVAAALGPAATIAALAASDRPIHTPAGKRWLFEATGAAAVDMESVAVARAAEAGGVPFLAVRVVADPAGRSVPPSALAGLRPDGTTGTFAVLRALAARPGDLVGLMVLAGDYRRARVRLRHVALRLAPGFGLA
jgi:adenosylhomocysteine nucleosidase